jgi:chaperonin GroEL
MEANLESPYLLVTDKPITSLVPLGKFLNEFVTKAKKLVIISPDISRDALGLFLQNKMEGKMLPLCIKAPGMAVNQKAILQDIAALTGATYITEDANHEFENVTMEHLGRATSVTSTNKETIITGGKGKKADVDERIAGIKAQLTQDQTDFQQIKLRERLGKLTSGVAVIYVGGHTEIEMKERRERVIDGIAATKAAMREGIVPGGEMIYFTARKALPYEGTVNKMLYNILSRPFRRLVENAGYDAGQFMERLQPDKLTITSKEAFGFNVATGQIQNFWETGIIDPASVSINALQNALSVACKLLCTKVIIIPDNDVSELQ